MASLLTADVAQLLTNTSMRPIVRKKAALALLRLLRKHSDNAEDILPADVSTAASDAEFCKGRPALIPIDCLASMASSCSRG